MEGFENIFFYGLEYDFRYESLIRFFPHDFGIVLFNMFFDIFCDMDFFSFFDWAHCAYAFQVIQVDNFCFQLTSEGVPVMKIQHAW